MLFAANQMHAQAKNYSLLSSPPVDGERTVSQRDNTAMSHESFTLFMLNAGRRNTPATNGDGLRMR